MTQPLGPNQQWADFTKKIFGQSKPPDIQYTEMRRAFYAGYVACFSDSMQVTELPMKTAALQLDKFHKELEAFGIDLMRGSA